MSKMTDLEWFEVEKFVTPPIVRKLKAMQAQLGACQWKPITETDLPKKGDETLNVTRWVMPVTIESQEWNAETWARNRWTHFRTINPPQQGAK